MCVSGFRCTALGARLQNGCSWLSTTDCRAHSSRDCGVVGLSETKCAAFAARKSPCPWEKHFQNLHVHVGPPSGKDQVNFNTALRQPTTSTRSNDSSTSTSHNIYWRACRVSSPVPEALSTWTRESIGRLSIATHVFFGQFLSRIHIDICRYLIR